MNGSSIRTPWFGFRLHPARGWAAALALLLVTLAPMGVARGAGNPVPDLTDCPELQVPAGHEVASTAYAEGVQIYVWNGIAWTFVAPEAVLRPGAGSRGVIGIHFAGPTWESRSGSQVVGSVLVRCTPDPAALPWLLLEAVSSQGPGVYNGVSYIQRVNTTGGLAPHQDGSFVGEVARVPYTAEYVFYRAR